MAINMTVFLMLADNLKCLLTKMKGQVVSKGTPILGVKSCILKLFGFHLNYIFQARFDYSFSIQTELEQDREWEFNQY